MLLTANNGVTVRELPRQQLLSPRVGEVVRAMHQAAERYDKLRLHLISLVSEETIAGAIKNPIFPIVKITLAVDRPSVLVPRLKIEINPKEEVVATKIKEAQRILLELLDPSTKVEKVLGRYISERPANRGIFPAAFEDWTVCRQLRVEDELHRAIVNINTRMAKQQSVVFDFCRVDSVTREEANLHYDESLGLYAVQTLRELRELVEYARNFSHGNHLGQLGMQSCRVGESSVQRLFVYNRGLSIFHDCQVGKFAQKLLEAKAFDIQKIFLVIDLFEALALPLNPERIVVELSKPSPPEPLAISGILRKAIDIRRAAGDREITQPEMERLMMLPDVRSFFKSSTPIEKPLAANRTHYGSSKHAPLFVSTAEEFEAFVGTMQTELHLSYEKRQQLMKLSGFHRKGLISRSGGVGTMSFTYLKELVAAGASLLEIGDAVAQYVAAARLARKEAEGETVGKVTASDGSSTINDNVPKEILINPCVVVLENKVESWLDAQQRTNQNRFNLVTHAINSLGFRRPTNEKHINGMGLDGVYRCRVPGAGDFRILYQRKGSEIRVLRVIDRKDLEHTIEQLCRDSSLKKKS